jgi:predicted nucleotidyltransferase
MNIEHLKHEIVMRITRQYTPEKIILFGSYATGHPRPDSDIDLIVVLDEPGFTQTYSQKIQRRLQIARLFYDMMATIPMDILVYTREEWNKLQEIKSSFIRDINRTGVPLL